MSKSYIKSHFKSIALNLYNEIPEDQKQFVRNSIKKYEADKSLLTDEETAWKMINAENENS